MLKSDTQRDLSLDAFRGLVIALMIFVNNTAGVSGIADWHKHAPGDVDAMTYPDLVFPWFLFAMGVAMPLALGKKASQGQSGPALAGMVLWRGASLIFLGVFFVCMEHGYAGTVLPKELWSAFFLLAAFVAWGRAAPRKAKLVAWAVLAVLAAIFRHKGEGGEVLWLRTYWWGILGLLGWVYMAAALVWAWARDSRPKLSAAMVILVLLYEAERVGALRWPSLPFFPGAWIGSHGAIAVAGMICGSWMKDSADQATRKIFGLGLVLISLAYLLRPFEGFSKIQGTAAWGLVCAGLGALLLGICQTAWRKGVAKRALEWIVPVGQNALFAYLLPDLVGDIFNLSAKTPVNLWGVFIWTWQGYAGMLNMALFTFLLLAAARWATRKGWLVIL